MTRKRKNIATGANSETPHSFDVPSSAESTDASRRYFEPPRSLTSSSSSKLDFPSEICAYLSELRKVFSDADDDNANIVRKALLEVEGHEAALLMFPDSCRVVEDFFGLFVLGLLTWSGAGFSQHTAEQFLALLLSLKNSVILDMFYSGCGSKVLECLLRLLTSSDSLLPSTIEVIERFGEILAKHPVDVVTTTCPSFIYRALLEIASSTARASLPKRRRASAGSETASRLATVYEQLTTFALDFNLLAEYLFIPVTAHVVQNAANCESSRRRVAKIDAFIDAALSHGDDPGKFVRHTMTKKVESNIWQALFSHCSDSVLKKVWALVICDDFNNLASDKFGNYVVEAFLANVNSPELAAEVAGRLQPIFEELTALQRDNVLISYLKCLVPHVDLQKKPLKELLKMFNADTKETKSSFLRNVLTMNSCSDSGEEFIRRAVPKGVSLARVLLCFTRNKTLCACIRALPADAIMAMAVDSKCSRVIDKVLESPTIPLDVKQQIAAAVDVTYRVQLTFVQMKWSKLVNDACGFYVFQKIWDNAFDEDQKKAFRKHAGKCKQKTPRWKQMMAYIGATS